jgi:hypothetical protein
MASLPQREVLLFRRRRGRIIEHVHAALLAAETERHCLLELEFRMAYREWLILGGRVKEMSGWNSIHTELDRNIASLLSG